MEQQQNPQSVAAFKAVLGNPPVIRRFSTATPVKFSAIAKTINTIFSNERAGRNLIVRYKDSDGDLCTISTTIELEEAMRVQSGGNAEPSPNKPILLHLAIEDGSAPNGAPASEAAPSTPTAKEAPPAWATASVPSVVAGASAPPAPSAPSAPAEIISAAAQLVNDILTRCPVGPEIAQSVNAVLRDIGASLPGAHAAPAEPAARPPVEAFVTATFPPRGAEGAPAAEPTDAVHHGITCDGCRMKLIVGPRYKCMECPDYDLCSACEKAGMHSKHQLMKMCRPGKVIVADVYPDGAIEPDDPEAAAAAAAAAFRAAGAPPAPKAEAGAAPGGGPAAGPAPEPQYSGLHMHVQCDGCGKHPIYGMRYHCATCANFDLCGLCYDRMGHTPGHDVRVMPVSENRFDDGRGRRGHCGRGGWGRGGWGGRGGWNHGPCGGWGGRGGWGRGPLGQLINSVMSNIPHPYRHPMHASRQPPAPPAAPAAPATPAAPQAPSAPAAPAVPAAPTAPQQQFPTARFVRDVTILDGTKVPAGTRFTKIWRLRNDGPERWPAGTLLAAVGGDGLSVVPYVPLAAVAQVGQEVDVPIDCVAPARAGRYKQHFRLAAGPGDSARFGQRFWVEIDVVEDAKGKGPALPLAAGPAPSDPAKEEEEELQRALAESARIAAEVEAREAKERESLRLMQEEERRGREEAAAAAAAEAAALKEAADAQAAAAAAAPAEAAPPAAPVEAAPAAVPAPAAPEAAVPAPAAPEAAAAEPKAEAEAPKAADADADAVDIESVMASSVADSVEVPASPAAADEDWVNVGVQAAAPSVDAFVTLLRDMGIASDMPREALASLLRSNAGQLQSAVNALLDGAGAGPSAAPGPQ